MDKTHLMFSLLQIAIRASTRISVPRMRRSNFPAYTGNVHKVKSEAKSYPVECTMLTLARSNTGWGMQTINKRKRINSRIIITVYNLLSTPTPPVSLLITCSCWRRRLDNSDMSLQHSLSAGTFHKQKTNVFL